MTVSELIKTLQQLAEKDSNQEVYIGVRGRGIRFIACVEEAACGIIIETKPHDLDTNS
jgi:hypothetical protein